MLLGVSLVVSGWMVRSGLESDRRDAAQPAISPQAPEQEDKLLLTLGEAAAWLSLTEAQVRDVISSEQASLNATGSYTGMLFPYIRVNGEIRVSKADLARWVSEAAGARRSYDIHR